MSGHTPGPWVEGESHETSVQIWSVLAKKTVARVECLLGDQKRLRADVRLIAAAPELLEALVNANKLLTQLMPGVKHIALQDYGFLNSTLMQVTAAIAKAEGKR